MSKALMMVDNPTEATQLKHERRDAVANRARLLSVAKTLFATQSVGQTTMQAIAQAAGVGQGTLYRHFADKAALCQALIHEDMEAFRTHVTSVLDNAALSPLTRLDLLMTEKNLLMEGHLQLFAAMESGTIAPERCLMAIAIRVTQRSG